jgi:hypothetical protein
MSVLVKVHSFSPVQFAEVVDMPTPDMLIIVTTDGKTHKVHSSLVKKFF